MRITIRIGDNELTRALLAGGQIAVLPSDLLYAGERERTRILQRTLIGRDFRNVPFAPYSRNGPYTYYPQGAGYRAERAALTARFAARIGVERLTRSGLGIKFENYAEFKASLGRMNVDLWGPRAPHMMQSLVVQVQDSRILIGIWGAEEAKAEGHNEGIRGRLPQRRFLDLTAESVLLIGEDIASIMSERLSQTVPNQAR